MRSRAAIVLLVLLVSALLSMPAWALPSHQSDFFIGQTGYLVDQTEFQMDAAPFIQDGRTLVPLRYLALALGVTEDKITWEPETKVVLLEMDSIQVSVQIGNSQLMHNGMTETMEVAPVIQDGRTYLPARYIAEAFGYQVGWEAARKAILIRPNPAPTPAPAPEPQGVTIQIKINNFAFDPSTITVNKGDTVTWTNYDQAPHTVTGAGIESGTMQKGSTFSFTFKETGTFDYICSIHPPMKGQVVVK